jgi:MoaA/NifB/PqqE/SkfB family radical SAM enzyme
MTEVLAEQPSGAWLTDQERVGKYLLPLVATEETWGVGTAEDGEEGYGESLVPSDFSDDSIDIFTNFLCYGAGSEDRPCLTTYCFLNAAQLKSKNMMSLEWLDRITGWAKSDRVGTEPGTFRTVSLLGGEFALHPHAKEIIGHLWAAGFNIRIVTNGSKQFQTLLEDDDVVDILRDETRDNLVAVSLDSVVEEDNDKNRGPGATRMALNTVEKLNRPGREIPFRINATPLLNCVNGLPALYRRAEELNARRLIVHYPDAVGRGRSLIPGPQSNKLSQQPDPVVWRKVRADAALYNQNCTERQSSFRVRCERGFGEVPYCHMVERRSSLHFAPQISDGRGSYITPAGACAFSMEHIDTESAYILTEEGKLYARKGSSQLTTARQVLAKTACCPLFPGRACIYDS